MRHIKDQRSTIEHIIKLAQQFIENYTMNMSKPVQKFLTQMICGIIISRSVIVQRIAVGLDEKISLKKVCDRLYRNLLNNSVLYERLMDAHILMQASIIREDSAIMVDLSDINKNGASMMEGLDNVWDGSESKPNKGYFTLQASICHYTEPKRVQLLYSELFSIEQESTSENEKILDLVHRVIVASGQRGIFVMDRGMDRCQILKDLVENDTSFIIRGDKRHLLYNGKSMSYRDIANTMTLNYEVSSKGRTFKAGVVPVQLALPNDEVTKNQRKKKANLYLVVALEPGRSFVYYLCRFRNPLSDELMLKMVVRYYGLRWGIEDVHRQIKQDFNWESIQLLKYLCLKNMNALLWIAASFLYNEVTKSIPILIKKHNNRMLYRKSESDKDINMMYRLTALVSEVMSYINIHRILKHVTNKRKPRYDNSGQLWIQWCM
jgi:hypothetical protein